MSCYYHPDREEVEFCDYCEVSICQDDIMLYTHYESQSTGTERHTFKVVDTLCPVCYYSQTLNKKRSWVGVILTGLLYGVFFTIVLVNLLNFSDRLEANGVDISNLVPIFVVLLLIPLVLLVYKPVREKLELPQKKEVARQNLLNFYRALEEIPNDHEESYTKLQTRSQQ